MSGGRGSALIVLTVVMAMAVVFQGQVTEAATYTVGGSGGWTFNVAGWPRGKTFKAGDVLVFNYGPGAHNVVRVNRAGYSGCNAPSGAKSFQSGRDQIKLAKGQNFFICSYAGHCEAGMKIAITAT
ncbi:basic blue protein-like [Primulina huaijiensis]|uniref:basic blue protein-like n=1 Tax=Primulina huaijiensis TaxID=1492673 RepID=UPI003CC76CD8